jgi:hypothetical protein
VQNVHIACLKDEVLNWGVPEYEVRMLTRELKYLILCFSRLQNLMLL